MEPQENPALERRAAETILQRGVKFKLAAPWYIKWFKKTVSVTLKEPYMGTMFRVSAYYLSTGINDEQLDELSIEESLALMAIHGKAISKAVACAILNGYWKGILFTGILARYLRNHSTPRELFALTTALTIYGGTADFINTTRSVRMMKATKPKLGQKSQGS